MNKGFSVIELLITCMVLTMLIALAMPKISRDMQMKNGTYQETEVQESSQSSDESMPTILPMGESFMIIY